MCLFDVVITTPGPGSVRYSDNKHAVLRARRMMYDEPLAPTKALQLVSYRCDNLSAVSYEHEDLRDRSSGTKAWFHRVILRSGSGYSPVAHTRASRDHSRGWRVAALVSCVAVGVVLLFNIIVTVYAVITYPPNGDGIGQFDSTNCDEVRNNNIVLHIGLNIVATILVGASNYNMQCLTAPTREEINKRHETDSSLDIGIQSVRNLRYLPRWKVILWASLLLSTLPLHLLWNSAVFAITELNNYGVVVVTSDYLESKNVYNESCQAYQTNKTVADCVTCTTIAQAKRNDSSLTKLTPKECIKHYSKKVETSYSNVLAVTKASNLKQSSGQLQPTIASLPVLAYIDAVTFADDLKSQCQCLSSTPGCNSTLDSPLCRGWDAGTTSWQVPGIDGTSEWICDAEHVFEYGCDLTDALTNSTQWSILPEHYQIDHCLASQRNSDCRFQYSATILYAVIGCNAIKFLAVAALRTYSSDRLAHSQQQETLWLHF